jgi:hypothetical protein
MNQKYIIPQNEEEAKGLLEQIKLLDGKDLNEEDILELGSIAVNTAYPGLRDMIALKFSDSISTQCIPFLIEAIKKNIHTQYISTLIYACSHHDCSEHLQLFVDLLILKKDMSFIDSYYVIRNMNNLSDKMDNLYAINKLKAFLNNVEIDFDLRNELVEAINLLQNLSNTQNK